MNLRKRITIILSVGLFIVLLVGLNAHRNDQRLISLNTRIVHTHLILQTTERIQAQLINTDNDLRGHLQSDNSFFKADFSKNARQLTGNLNELQVLTQDNAGQQHRLQRINTLLARKFSQSRPLFAAGAIAAGGARLNAIRSVLDLSDSLRLLLQAVESNEKALLLARNTESDQVARIATLTNAGGVLVAIGLIAWAIYLLVQTLETTKQLNKRLKDSEQRNQKFLEAVPISVVVIDAEGNFYYANKAATSMFGNTTAHFGTYANTLKKIQIFRSSDQQIYPVADRPIYRAMRGETTQIDDMEMRIGDRVVQIMTSASPVYDSDNVLQYIVSSTVDISDRAQSELKLQQAKELAEEAVRIKENFLANMSHEIRTPLNAIIGFSNLLETTALNAEQQEFVTSIRTAGKNLLTIVNDILDISKIEAGMLQFESIPFNIDSLAGSIQTMFQSTASDKKLSLVVDTDPTLPQTVLGDPTRLTQILLNLLSNSLKFTKEGGVTVTIKNMEQTDESVRVRFSVRDTGIGMAAEVLPHIFERFRQATEFTTRYYGGTGLGLNIVKSLTEMQGGWVTVDSTLGEGSCFTLELIYLVAATPIEPETGLTNAQPGMEGSLLTILVAEDNLMNQKLAIQVLKRLSYNTLIAENGKKAIDILESGTSIDVVLMDIQMPVMDGYETTRYIRNTLRSTIPIIAMTAHALASERELCLQAGMNDFVPKPFQIDELQRILRRYIIPVDGPEKPPVVADTSPAPKAAFSVTLLMEAVGNEADFAAEVLTLFLGQTPGELETLQRAVQQGNLDVISRIIHIQKVPTQMFGLTEATRQILTIEDLIAARQEITQVGPLVNHYIEVLSAELPGIHEALQAMNSRVGQEMA